MMHGIIMIYDICISTKQDTPHDQDRAVRTAPSGLQPDYDHEEMSTCFWNLLLQCQQNYDEKCGQACLWWGVDLFDRLV